MEKIAIFLKKSSKNGGNGRKTMKKGKSFDFAQSLP